MRLKGGLAQLIEQLVSQLPAHRLHLRSPVTKITEVSADAVYGIEVRMDNNSLFSARQVVLALPSRITSKITFSPALPKKSNEVALSIPTWVAGHAKVVAIYKTPFWKEHGLSGDATSRHGPLVEIHDASPLKGGPYAFIHVGHLAIVLQNLQSKYSIIKVFL